MDELVLQIMAKALEVNHNTKHSVFVWYSGHTESIDFSVYKNGWNEHKDYDINTVIYLDFEEAENQLKEALETLEKLERGE